MTMMAQRRRFFVATLSAHAASFRKESLYPDSTVKGIDLVASSNALRRTTHILFSVLLLSNTWHLFLCNATDDAARFFPTTLCHNQESNPR